MALVSSMIPLNSDHVSWKQIGARIKNGLSALPIPEPFLAELAAMPPSAGIALGVDRLVMLFTGATHIDDVIAFTPEEL